METLKPRLNAPVWLDGASRTQPRPHWIEHGNLRQHAGATRRRAHRRRLAAAGRAACNEKLAATFIGFWSGTRRGQEPSYLIVGRFFKPAGPDWEIPSVPT